MSNYTTIDEVCGLSENVYFNVVEHLGLYDVMIKENPKHKGSSVRNTENTEKGQELYYLIENVIAEHLGVEI